MIIDARLPMAKMKWMSLPTSPCCGSKMRSGWDGWPACGLCGTEYNCAILDEDHFVFVAIPAGYRPLHDQVVDD